MKPAELWDRAVCTLYPPRCVLCGEVVRYEDSMCGACSCEEEPLLLPAAGCLAGIAAPFAYEQAIRHAVQTLKQYRDRRTLCFFAEYMQGLLAAEDWRDFDMVVPVAASRKTLRVRGFNQAAELAGELAAMGNIPCHPKVLGRRSRAQTQHSLAATERRENAAASYFLRDGEGLRGKKVLLVDDVYTTGATLEACAALLTGAGATVYGITACYTPRRGQQAETGGTASEGQE